MARGAVPSLLVVAALVTLSAPSAAEPGARATLRWRAAATCIDEATLARTVEGALGHRVFDATGAAASAMPPAIIIEGGVEPSGGGFRASIAMRSSSGALLASRSLESVAASCNRMDESIAVVIAIMLDGFEPERPPIQVQPSPPRVAPTPRAPATPVVAGEAGAGVSLGILPRAAPTAYLRFAVDVAIPVSLTLGMHAWVPERALYEGAGGEISGWAADLGACYTPLRAARVRLGACLGGGGGFLVGAPIGLLHPAQVTRPLVFGEAEVDASVRIAGPVWGRLGAALWVPLVRPRFFFHDGAEERDVATLWPVAPSFTLGVVVRPGS
ncbi:hypothetical protein A7982_13947 [Minicystis rosea]|nr:hypothetical protein A7982_13947 [Minicystis rosea]